MYTELIQKLEQSFKQQKKWLTVIQGDSGTYHPTYFRRMILTDGYYRTIKKMVSKQEKTAGLQSLWGINRLDESCEYFVALTEVGKEYEEYHELFTDEERAYCVDFLENDYGFNFKTKSWKY